MDNLLKDEQEMLAVVRTFGWAEHRSDYELLLSRLSALRGENERLRKLPQMTFEHLAGCGFATKCPAEDCPQCKTLRENR